MTLVEAATTFLVWFGGGSLLGFVAGYAIKKILKIGAVIVGLFVFGVMWLSYAGIARIDWHKAEYVTRSAVLNASTQMMNVVNNTAAQYVQHQSAADTSTLPAIAGAGFLIGFLGGLKRG